MLAELEAAVADSLRRFGAGGHAFLPTPGVLCANCDAPLEGRYCHACGQDADTHKRSILHLTWEGIEGLFHLDGRLLRTLPDLFLRPGRLARDYMENRIARHVPPFRTFLVALLLFVFAAEHATHEIQVADAARKRQAQAALATPAGRLAEATKIRREARKDLTGDLSEAASDRVGDLKDGATLTQVDAAYARDTATAKETYDAEMKKADRVMAGLGDETAPAVTTKLGGSWWKVGLRKAIDNPDYFETILFTWVHRAAILLLPIVGGALALVYARRRGIFFYDHLLVAMNLLSFVFLTNAVGLVLPAYVSGWWLGLATLWTPVNLFQTLRGAYGSSIAGAVLKTVFVWLIAVIAFTALLTGLVLFTLTQL